MPGTAQLNAHVQQKYHGSTKTQPRVILSHHKHEVLGASSPNLFQHYIERKENWREKGREKYFNMPFTFFTIVMCTALREI